MKREQDDTALGLQPPLPWLDELLPSACEEAWAPDDIFNFDASPSVREDPLHGSQGAAKRPCCGLVRGEAGVLDAEDGDDCGQPSNGSRRQRAGVKTVKADREKARRQRESDSLIELSKLLDPGQNARRDKLSVLTDAIREVTRLRTEAVSLQRLNKILEDRLQDVTAKLETAPEPAPATAPQPTQRPGMMMQQYFSQPVPVTQLQQPAAQAGAADKPPLSQLPVLQQQAAQQPPVQQEMQAPTQQGMVALPAAMLQQMLAIHQARMDAAAKAMFGTTVTPHHHHQQQQPAAVVKETGASDKLSSAACLYLPSADLDVSADGMKRPPAA